MSTSDRKRLVLYHINSADTVYTPVYNVRSDTLIIPGEPRQFNLRRLLRDQKKGQENIDAFAVGRLWIESVDKLQLSLWDANTVYAEWSSGEVCPQPMLPIDRAIYSKFILKVAGEGPVEFTVDFDLISVSGGRVFSYVTQQYASATPGKCLYVINGKLATAPPAP